MNERDFVFWLQGFFEMTGSNELTTDQVKMVKEHLALVLHKETKFAIYECSGDPNHNLKDFPLVSWSDIQVTC